MRGPQCCGCHVHGEPQPCRSTTASKWPRPERNPSLPSPGLKEIQALAEQYLNAGVIPAAATRGEISVHDVLKDYSEYLRQLVDLSGSRPLKIVVDAGNGMAGLTTPAVLGDQLLPGPAVRDHPAVLRT